MDNQLMDYTLLTHETERKPDVVVIYDNHSNLFIVNFTKSGVDHFSPQKVSDYNVRYADLVSECYKYLNEVIGKILSKIPDTDDDIPVYFSNEAYNAAHLVVNGNRELY